MRALRIKVLKFGEKNFDSLLRGGHGAPPADRKGDYEHPEGGPYAKSNQVSRYFDRLGSLAGGGVCCFCQ